MLQYFSAESSTTFINPYSYRILRKRRPQYLDGRMNLCIDGISLVILARLLGSKSEVRRSFDDTSMAPKVFDYCAERGLSIAIVGSAPSVAIKASELIVSRYPGVVIQYVSDGFFPSESEPSVLASAANADVVLCSMGTPRQEDFLWLLRDIGWKGIGFTCGGFLDQLVEAGGSAYYPPLINALNLRWVYRIVKEPRRLLPRYLIDYPLGMSLYMADVFRARNGR